MRPVLRFGVLSLSTLFATPAVAGGYYYSDSGVVATGRGGAWVAGADTQFAQWYNPAGLIRIKRPTINAGWSGVQQNVDFTRMRAEPDENGDEFFDPVQNEAKPFNVPQLGFAMPIGEDLAVAFGIYTPFAPSAKYPEEGAQRYSVKNTTIFQGSIGPSVAYRPRFLPQVVIGAGVNVQFLSVQQAMDITTVGTDDPSGDVAIDLTVQQLARFGYNAGVLIEPVEEISIGLSIIPGMRFTTTGRAEIDFEGSLAENYLNQIQYTDPDVTAQISLPMVLRAGVAVRPVPKLEIEAAVVGQRWSQVPDIEVTDVNVDLDVKEGSLLDLILNEDDRQINDDFVIPQLFKDTISYRLGAEYQVVPELAIRAGGFYETSSLEAKHVDVALYDTQKWQVGLGATGWMLDSRLRIDAAFAMLFLDSLQVRDSERLQTNAGVLPNTGEQVVGNGDYRSNGWIAGLQAQWAFGSRQ